MLCNTFWIIYQEAAIRSVKVVLGFAITLRNSFAYILTLYIVCLFFSTYFDQLCTLAGAQCVNSR